jgi:long-subunit acyl-CoA synthetase (AMP-forming)
VSFKYLGYILTASPQMLKERFDTVGKPSENVEVKIKNPNAYGHGELLIKGENVMNGYFGFPTVSKRSLSI